MALFSKFASSWTPSFLHKYGKSLTVGKSIGYYFFWWFMMSLGIIIIGGIFAWRFSTPERVLPLLNKVPPFELQFKDNQLIKTSFPTDPYKWDIIAELQSRYPRANIKNDIDFLYFSTKETTIPSSLQWAHGVFFLKDGMMANTSSYRGNDKMPYKTGTITLDNSLMKTMAAEMYPGLRQRMLPVIVICVALIFAFFVSIFSFLFCFFWAFVVFIISQIGDMPRLTYEKALMFVFHLFFPVMIVCGIFCMILSYFPFLTSLFFILAYLYNSSKLPRKTLEK